MQRRLRLPFFGSRASTSVKSGNRSFPSFGTFAGGGGEGYEGSLRRFHGKPPGRFASRVLGADHDPPLWADQRRADA